MPRGPKGKRVATADGSYSVVSKNSNRDGSVYFDAPSTRADGTVVKGRWRATYVDLDGKTKRVSGATRALAEARRNELLATLEQRRPLRSSRFSITTTVQELARLVARLGRSTSGARVVARHVPQGARLSRRRLRPRPCHRCRAGGAHRVAVEPARPFRSVHGAQLPQSLPPDLHRGRQARPPRLEPVRSRRGTTRPRDQGGTSAQLQRTRASSWPPRNTFASARR